VVVFVDVDDRGCFDFFFVCCVASVLAGVGGVFGVGIGINIGVNIGVNAVPKHDLPRDWVRHRQFEPLFLIFIPQRPHHNLVLCDICAVCIGGTLQSFLFAFSLVVCLSLSFPRAGIGASTVLIVVLRGVGVDAVFDSIPMQLTSIIRACAGVRAKCGVERGGYVGCGSVAVALGTFFGGQCGLGVGGGRDGSSKSSGRRYGVWKRSGSRVPVHWGAGKRDHGGVYHAFSGSCRCSPYRPERECVGFRDAFRWNNGGVDSLLLPSAFIPRVRGGFARAWGDMGGAGRRGC